MSKGGDFSREAINLGAAIIRGNTVTAAYEMENQSLNFQILAYVHTMPDSFSCRHEKLTGIASDQQRHRTGTSRSHTIICLPRIIVFPRIVAPLLMQKRNNRPRYYSRKYGIRYVTLHIRDRRFAALLRYRNRAEIAARKCEQKSYPVWFSFEQSNTLLFVKI